MTLGVDGAAEGGTCAEETVEGVAVSLAGAAGMIGAEGSVGLADSVAGGLAASADSIARFSASKSIIALTDWAGMETPERATESELDGGVGM